MIWIRPTDPRSPEADVKKEDWLLSEQLVEFVDRDLVKEVFEECLRPAAHIRARLLLQHVTPEWQQRELWQSRVLGDSDIRHSSLGGVSVVRSSASSSAFSR